MKPFHWAAALVLLVGCGSGGNNGGSTGASGPKLTSNLKYTDPTGTGWRVVQTGTVNGQPVLGLVGPVSLVRAIAVTVEPDTNLSVLDAGSAYGAYSMRKAFRYAVISPEGMGAALPVQSWSVSLNAPTSGAVKFNVTSLVVADLAGNATNQPVAVGKLEAVE